MFEKSGGESGASSDESSGHLKSKVSKVSSSKKKSRLKLDDFYEGARYFVMKSNNHENIALSKAKVQCTDIPEGVDTAHVPVLPVSISC